MKNEKTVRFVGFKRLFTVLRHPEQKTEVDFEIFRRELKTFICFFEYLKTVPAHCFNVGSRLRSRLFKKPVIHVMGDSHANIFRYDLRFVVHHLGAATMFGINRKNSATRSYEQVVAISKKLDPSLDKAMFVLGEIDCRLHIYNQYERNKGTISITTLIEKAISNLAEVLKIFEGRGVKICIHGIPPARQQANYYNMEFYASREMVGRIFKEFHLCLQKFCRANHYTYIDIYSKLSDQDGFVKRGYLVDDLHLKKETVGFISHEIDDFIAGTNNPHPEPNEP